jgi:hypothetical protein
MTRRVPDLYPVSAFEFRVCRNHQWETRPI